MDRRRFVQTAFASSGLLLGASSARRVKLGYVGYPCEAVTFSAPNGAAFRKYRLDAELFAFESEARLISALGAGAIDGASMNLPALLEPLQSGADIRISAGLHAGCLRVVAPEDVIVRSLGNLKGSSIAVDRLGGPSMNLLSALLRRQGIDPQHDVTWHAYPPALIESALDEKSADCVAASDPVGYYLISDKKATPYLNTADGGFTCGEGISRGHHCFLALNGRFVTRERASAAALTRAYVEASNRLSNAVGAAALEEVRGNYTAGDMYATIGMLSSYDWHATADFVLEEIELTARDFRRAGLLRSTTDPEQLAEAAFADIIGS